MGRIIGCVSLCLGLVALAGQGTAASVGGGYTFSARLADYFVVQVDYLGNTTFNHRPVGDYSFGDAPASSGMRLAAASGPRSTTFSGLRVGDTDQGSFSFGPDADGDLTVPYCTGNVCDGRATWFSEGQSGVFFEGGACACLQTMRNFGDADTAFSLYGVRLGARMAILYNDDDGVFSDDVFSNVYSIGEVAVFELYDIDPNMATAPLPGTAWLLLGALGGLAAKRRLRRG